MKLSNSAVLNECNPVWNSRATLGNKFGGTPSNNYIELIREGWISSAAYQ